MTQSLPSDHEARRLRALRNFYLLDTPPEQVLDDLATLAAHLCETPIGLVALIDAHRGWLKSTVGWDVTEMPRDIGLCTHAIMQRDVFVVPDATRDDRFAHSPLVTGEPHIRFYAGAPLVTSDGYALGTLCVIDRVPRTLTPMQLEALQVLSRQVMAQLERRRHAHELASSNQTLTAVTESLAAYVERGDWQEAMGRLLRRALDQTQSEYGFVGVVVGSTLRVLAHEGIVWDEVINRDFYEQALRSYDTVGYVEFTSFNNLFGRAITTGQVVVANAPDADPRSTGRPTGHPPMRSFLGVPIFGGEQVLGMVALANRPGGYSEDEQRRIETLVQHAGALCASYRQREAAIVLEQERAQAEAALDQAEGHRRAVWQSSLDAVITMDESGHILDFNPAAETIFGYRAAEVIGQPLADRIIPSALREGHRRGMERFLATGQSAIMGRRIELSALRSDGTEFPVELTVVAVAGSDRPTFLGTVRDITKRKRAEAALQKSEGLLRIAGQAARLGGWTLDLPEQTLAWSDETFRIHDLPPGTPPTLEEAIRFYPPEYRDEVTRHVHLCATEGRHFDFELELIAATQRRISVRAIGEAVRDADGRIARVQGAFQDITEQKAAEALARGSAERLAQTLESITDSFFTLDREWRFTYVNAAAERVMGRHRSTLLGRSIWETYPEVVGSTSDREYRRAMATNTTVAFEESYPSFGLWFEVRAYPTAEGLAVYFRDVSEHRRLSAALRASESQFRQLAESNVLGILFWNALGNISDANDAFLRMVGYTREELERGQIDWRRMTPPEYLAQDERALAEIAATGSCTPFEKEYLHKEGHRVAVLIGAAALDGATDRGICYVVDISQQKQAEATLRVSEERFRLLAKATNDAIWDWNLITNQLWWNEGYETLFGYARADVDPTISSWTDHIHPDDATRVTEDIRRVIEHGGASWSDEYRFRCKDGRYAHVLDRGHVIRDAAGKPMRMIGGMTDLTTLKEHEIALSQNNRALQLLSRCNEALIRSESESGLLAAICQIAVDVGGFPLAWVGYARDDADNTVECQSYAGIEDGFLSAARITWADDSPAGHGPAGRAIRHGVPVVIPDIESDDGFRPWRELARARGFRGVIALPLADKQRTFGVLVLYLPEARQPLPDEMRLLRELADDLAFGIVNIRTRLDQQRIHAAVEQVATAVSAATGKDFFEQLARNMALAVGADAGFVARVLPGEPLTARTIAAVVDCQVVDNFDYVIEGTPCESFLTTDAWVIHEQVAELFPRSPSLTALGAQGYIGRRLDNSAGQFQGLLFVVFREPIAQADFAMSTLRIFAARAAAEMEREETDSQVRKQAALLDKAQDAIIVRDLDHRITYWNHSAARLYGWTAQEALGRSVRELFYL